MMMPLLEAIIAVWTPFAALFTQPVWHHAQVLWMAVSAQPPEKVKLAEMEVWPILSESRVRKMASVRNLLSSLSYIPSGA